VSLDILSRLQQLILIACVAAAAHADCNQVQRIMLKTQWAQAYTEGLDREAFGQAIFRTLFHIDPEARDIFSRVNSADVNSAKFNAHAMRVLGGLDMSFSLLDDTETLAAQLAHLKAQHVERHITAGNFRDFGRAMREVIPAAIGQCYNDDIWEDCFSLVAEGISSL